MKVQDNTHSFPLTTSAKGKLAVDVTPREACLLFGLKVRPSLERDETDHFPFPRAAVRPGEFRNRKTTV